MSIFQPRCTHCGEPLYIGDKIRKIRDYVLYHPECYTIRRTEDLRTLGDFERNSLMDAYSLMNRVHEIFTTNDIAETDVFYSAWGDLLSCNTRLEAVYAMVKMFGEVGMIEGFKLNRSFKRLSSSIFEISERYREEYGAVNIDRIMQEMYPSSNNPSIEDLEKLCKAILDEIIEDSVTIYTSLRELHEKLSEILRKSLINRRKNIEKEIREIQQLVEVLTEQ